MHRARRSSTGTLRQCKAEEAPEPARKKVTTGRDDVQRPVVAAEKSLQTQGVRCKRNRDRESRSAPQKGCRTAPERRRKRQRKEEKAAEVADGNDETERGRADRVYGRLREICRWGCAYISSLRFFIPPPAPAVFHRPSVALSHSLAVVASLPQPSPTHTHTHTHIHVHTHQYIHIYKAGITDSYGRTERV